MLHLPDAKATTIATVSGN